MALPKQIWASPPFRQGKFLLLVFLLLTAIAYFQAHGAWMLAVKGLYDSGSEGIRERVRSQQANPGAGLQNVPVGPHHQQQRDE